MEHETIHCRRCGPDAPRLPRPPFKNEMGERVAAEICADCWNDWLKHQTLLINHYGLDPRDPQARAFLFEQIETVLLGDGNAQQVDTRKQGTIDW